MIGFGLDALSVIFELLIYQFFFHHFFGKPRFSKAVMVLVYGAVGVASLWLSVADISNDLQVIGYFAVIIILAFCYSERIFIKIFIPFLFQAIGMVVENCYSVILFPVKEAAQIYGQSGQQFYYFIGIVLSNLTILLILRLLTSYQGYLFLRRQDIPFPLYFVVLFFFPLMILYIIDQFSLLSAQAGALGWQTVWVVVLLTVIAIAFFFLFDAMLQTMYNRQQMDLLRKQLAQEQEYHAVLLNKHQQLQELRHDSRKHFETVAGLLKNGHTDDALAYAQQQSGKLALTAVVQTGVPLLDTIFTLKAEQAQQAGVQFESYVSVQLQPENIALDDLASLLTNGLDNALEAVQNIEDPQHRKIWCRLVQDGSYLHITVRNTVARPVVIAGNTIATTKADKKLHGFGMGIIKRVTEKYDGSYQFSCQHNVFTLKIMLLLDNIKSCKH